MIIKQREWPSKLITYRKLETELLISSYKQLKIDLFEDKMERYGKRWVRNVPSENDSTEKTRTITNFKELRKGSLVFFEERKEPFRGIRTTEAFQAGFIWKKAIVLLLQFINGKQGFKKKNIFQKIVILISLLVNYEFYIRFIHHALLDHFYDNPDRNSQSVRELYRVMQDFPQERDIVCFFLEADWAYRLRFQDVVSELDKTAFNENPLKETLRLLDLLADRESYQGEGGVKTKWVMMKRLIPLAYLYVKIFKRSLFKKIIKAVDNINLGEIKFSKEDQWWAYDTDSYNSKGLSFEIRKRLQ